RGPWGYFQGRRPSWFLGELLGLPGVRGVNAQRRRLTLHRGRGNPFRRGGTPRVRDVHCTGDRGQRGGRGGIDPAGVEAAVDLSPLDQMGAEAAEQIGIRPERIGLKPEVIERSLESQAPDVVYRDAAHLDGRVM